MRWCINKSQCFSNKKRWVYWMSGGRLIHSSLPVARSKLLSSLLLVGQPWRWRRAQLTMPKIVCTLVNVVCRTSLYIATARSKIIHPDDLGQWRLRVISMMWSKHAWNSWKLQPCLTRCLSDFNTPPLNCRVSKFIAVWRHWMTRIRLARDREIPSQRVNRLSVSHAKRSRALNGDSHQSSFNCLAQ